MHRTLALLSVVLTIGFLTPAARAEEKLDFYFKDGKLTQTLEIKDVQGGFAGFTGKQWTVTPSGEWKLSRVFNEKLEVMQQGTLTAAQLKQVAEALARYDLAGLESKAPTKPMANPHVVTITFGKRAVNLTLGAGEPLPKPDAAKPRASVETRFAGIVAAVEEVAKEIKADK